MTTLPHPIPIPLAEAVAARLRAMADPVRLRILDRLRDGERSVGDLAASLGTSQQNVSKHLGVLLRSRIVSRRKHGTTSLYAIADEGVLTICASVCGGLRSQADELAALLDTAFIDAPASLPDLDHHAAARPEGTAA